MEPLESSLSLLSLSLLPPPHFFQKESRQRERTKRFATTLPGTARATLESKSEKEERRYDAVFERRWRGVHVVCVFVVRVFVVVVVVAKSRERKKGGAASHGIVVESGGTKNYPKLALRGEKIRTTAFVSGGGGGGGRMLFPLAPGRAKDERNQSEILLRAISEPRKSASTEDEVTAETKTGSQRATTPSSSSKSSSSAGKKKTFVANNKKKKNSGKKTKGYSSSRNYKPFKPTSSKVSNARRKKFAPLIAGVADDVPLNELLKKYPNFEDCLGPKKYDSGHFIRLYSDLVRCDRLGDAIDLLQRLSDAKVPCLNDTRIRKYGPGGFLGVVRTIEQVEEFAGDACVYVYEFSFGSLER